MTSGCNSMRCKSLRLSTPYCCNSSPERTLRGSGCCMACRTHHRSGQFSCTRATWRLRDKSRSIGINSLYAQHEVSPCRAHPPPRQEIGSVWDDAVPQQPAQAPNAGMPGAQIYNIPMNAGQMYVFPKTTASTALGLSIAGLALGFFCFPLCGLLAVRVFS